MKICTSGLPANFTVGDGFLMKQAFSSHQHRYIRERS